MRTIADGKITISTEIDSRGAEKGVSNLKGKLQGTAKKAQKIGGSMTKYLTAPLLAVGGMAFTAADNLDQAYGRIQTATGATGDALEGLKDDFDEVFSSVPDSAQVVSDALGTINTLTGASGEVLQGLTENVLDAARSLDEDGVQASEAFGKAMSQWQIPAKEGQGHLDHLFKLTQDYGIGLGEVSSHLTEYGSVLQNAGFDMAESADLFGRLESNGISVSRIMPGLNQAFRNWASEGKNSREELGKTISAMKDAETNQEALSIAAEAFGAEGAQRLMTAIENDALPALDGLGQGMEGAKGAIEDNTEATETFGEKMGTLRNKASVSLAPLGDILLDLAENALPPVVNAIESLADWFKNLSPAGQKVVVVLGGLMAILPPIIMLAGSLAMAIMGISWPVLAVIAGIGALIAIGAVLIANWDKIKAATLIVWEAIKIFFQATWTAIKTTFMTAVQAIWGFIQSGWNMIKNMTTTVFNAVWSFIQSVWNGIKSVFNTVVSWIVDFVKGRWNALKSNVTTVFNAIKNVISTVWNTIKSVTSGVWNGIKSTLGGIWNGLKSSVSGAFNWIKDTISGVWDSVKSSTDSIWDGITGSVKGAVNGVIGAINGMIDALNGLSIDLPTIPDWVKYGVAQYKVGEFGKNLRFQGCLYVA